MTTVSEAFEFGLRQHQAGRFTEAEHCYRQIIQADPDHADAWHLLGVLASQMGQYTRGVECIQRAVALRPGIALYQSNLGEVYRKAGRLEEAIACCRAAVTIAPDFAQAHNSLGLALEQLKRHDEAVKCYREALRAAPEFPEAWLNLGNALHELALTEEAAQALEQALRLRPEFAEAHNSLGLLWQGAGQLVDAEAAYRRALAAQPRFVAAANNLAILLYQQQRLIEAESLCQDALRQHPDSACLWNTLGLVLLRRGALLEAEASCRQALQHEPHLAAAHHHLALVLHDQGRVPEAIAACRQAVQSDPQLAAAFNTLGVLALEYGDAPTARETLARAQELDDALPEVHNNLGMLFALEGRVIAARESFAQAYALNPSVAYRLKSAMVFPVIADSAHEQETARTVFMQAASRLHDEGVQLDDPVREAGLTRFLSAYSDSNERPYQEELARLWAKLTPSLGYVAPHCKARTKPRRGGPLRIGFVSKFFHEHTISKLFGGIIRNLARDRFRVILFRFPGTEDRWSEFLRQSADEHVLLVPRLEQAREQIAAQELDILFFPDVGMDPMTYFLAFARLAPLQCASWGHPVTTGIPTIDVFLSSASLEPPDAATHYSERLVLLQNLPTYYCRPERLGSPLKRHEIGVAPEGHIYLCPQSLFKLHPDFDAVLREILQADQAGVLLLIAGQHPYWTERLMARFRQTLPGVIERVTFLPRLSPDRFLDVLATADAILDPLYFSGGNTSYEAFSVGAPIVTLPGAQMRGRVTSALYHRMGIEDCIATNLTQYVDLAVRCGTDPVWRESVRRRILEANGLLYETIAAVRELEDVLESLALAGDTR